MNFKRWLRIPLTSLLAAGALGMVGIGCQGQLGGAEDETGQALSTTYNDSAVGTGENQFNYSGNWSTSTGDGKYDNDDHYSSTAGATVTFKFSGAQIILYGAKASWHGIAQVSVDNGAVTNVDAYSATRADQVALYTSASLGAGSHTLTVKITGTHSGSSSDSVFSVDKVPVPAASATTTTIDDATTGTSSGQFSYAGTWSTSTGTDKYKGSDHYSDTANATATLHFTGTKVALYGAKAAWHGIASIRVDTGTVTNVNAYAANRVDQSLLYTSSALASGSHTLTITVTGTHGSGSTGNVFAIDRADVTSGGSATPVDAGTPDAGTGNGGGGGGTPDAGTDGGTIPSGQFLSRSGNKLYLNGAPYRFVGLNAFGMEGCQTGSAYSDAQLDAYFASLRPHSMPRTWAFSNYGTSNLDRVVASAERHGQMLIISLADGAGYCGESDGRSGGEGTQKTPAWFGGGYQSNYIPWVKQVSARYRASTAIGMYELINEPRANGVSSQTMRNFFDAAAAAIKSQDPNHLVESGAMAEYAPGTEDYALVHGGPNVDVASVHEYDYDYNNSHTIVSGHVTNVLNQMKSLNKPTIVGETGISSGDGCSTSRQTRANAFEEKFDQYLADGIVGVLAWNWFPNQAGGCAYETIYPGDPLMGTLLNYSFK